MALYQGIERKYFNSTVKLPTVTKMIAQNIPVSKQKLFCAKFFKKIFKEKYLFHNHKNLDLSVFGCF